MSITPAERQAMQRALELAAQGPRTLNPQVGAVMLDAAGNVLGEGLHHGAGTPHAEVEALRAASAKPHTAVVTLEPCNHVGRTGPCATALIDAGVQRVIYATSDPGADSGGGAERLREAGIEAIALEPGELRDKAEALIADWLVAKRLGRPHITLKWAQSLDGRAAAADGTSQWITGPEARADVHIRRAQTDVIVAGTGTVLADNPALTARTPDGELAASQPRAVVIGGSELPVDAAVRQHPAGFEQHSDDLTEIVRSLYERGTQRIFVEGGPTLASAFIRERLVDEFLIYTAPTLLGGDRLAVTNIGVHTITDQLRLTVLETTMLGTDVFVRATPVWPEENA